MNAAASLADAFEVMRNNVPTISVVAMMVRAAMVARRDERHHAWLIGALLPIDAIAHVSPRWLDVARYLAVGWLALRIRPDIGDRAAVRIDRLAGLLVALGAWSGAVAVWRGDDEARVVALAIAGATPFAYLLARRVSTHLHVFSGFLAGVSLSAVVALAQAIGFDAIRPGGPSGRRNPGLAGSTAITTWHMAIGIVIAVFLLLSPDTRRPVRLMAGAAAALCAAGLLACGAQGGFIGLGAAAMATILRPPHELRRWLTNWRVLLTLGIAVVAGLGLGLLTNSPTLSGFLGEGNYANETARLDLNSAAWREFTSNPLVGIGSDQFRATYGLMPHLLPLDAGISSGVVGFLLALGAILYAAWLLFAARPEERSLVTWFGLALGCLLLVNSLTERDAALIGFSRLPLLLLSLVAVQGERWPSPAVPGQPPSARPRSENRGR